MKQINPILYFDATGSILPKIRNQKTPYLYTIVCHDTLNKKIIPIAEWFSTSHTQLSISKYLFIIKNYYKQYSDLALKKHRIFVYPPIIVTDFSWALVNSVLDVFNNMTMKSYLQIAFEIILLDDQSKLNSINTMIYLCSTHFLHNIIKKVKAVSNDAKIRKILVYSFSLLQNAKNIKEFEFYLENVFIIFKSKKKNSQYLNSFNLIKSSICFLLSRLFVFKDGFDVVVVVVFFYAVNDRVQ